VLALSHRDRLARVAVTDATEFRVGTGRLTCPQ
jgi:hypothetical protein